MIFLLLLVFYSLKAISQDVSDEVLPLYRLHQTSHTIIIDKYHLAVCFHNDNLFFLNAETGILDTCIKIESIGEISPNGLFYSEKQEKLIVYYTSHSLSEPSVSRKSTVSGYNFNVLCFDAKSIRQQWQFELKDEILMQINPLLISDSLLVLHDMGNNKSVAINILHGVTEKSSILNVIKYQDAFISPDGKYLAFWKKKDYKSLNTTFSSTIKIWDIQKERIINSVKINVKEGIKNLGFINDGTIIATSKHGQNYFKWNYLQAKSTADKIDNTSFPTSGVIRIVSNDSISQYVGVVSYVYSETKGMDANYVGKYSSKSSLIGTPIISMYRYPIFTKEWTSGIYDMIDNYDQSYSNAFAICAKGDYIILANNREIKRIDTNNWTIRWIYK